LPGNTANEARDPRTRLAPASNQCSRARRRLAKRGPPRYTLDAASDL